MAHLMDTYVSFLRAINISKNSTLAMKDLKSLYEELGCSNVKTVLQTGNVVFDSNALPDLEVAIEKRFSFKTTVILKPLSEIQKLIESKPFSKHETVKPSWQMVMFLSHAPQAKDVQALAENISDHEVIWNEGKELFIVYPDGVGRSKLTTQKIEKALHTTGTMRNWNTVCKLVAT